MKKILIICVLSVIWNTQVVFAAVEVDNSQLEKLDRLIEKLVYHQLTNPSDLEAKKATNKLIETRNALVGQTYSHQKEIVTEVEARSDSVGEEVAAVGSYSNNTEKLDNMRSLKSSPAQNKVVGLTPRRLLTHDLSSLLTPRKIFVSLFN